MKKTNIIFVACMALMIVLTGVFVALMKNDPLFKYLAFAFMLAFAVLGTIFKILLLVDSKKQLEEEMPIYFAEMYNSGVITKEQMENPGKIEKEMFYTNMGYSKRKRIFIIVIFAILIVQMAISILFI